MQCAFPRSLDSNQYLLPFYHDTETDSVALRGFDVKELVYVKIG